MDYWHQVAVGFMSGGPEAAAAVAAAELLAASAPDPAVAIPAGSFQVLLQSRRGTRVGIKPQIKNDILKEEKRRRCSRMDWSVFPFPALTLFLYWDWISFFSWCCFLVQLPAHDVTMYFFFLVIFLGGLLCQLSKVKFKKRHLTFCENLDDVFLAR